MDRHHRVNAGLKNGKIMWKNSFLSVDNRKPIYHLSTTGGEKNGLTNLLFSAQSSLISLGTKQIFYDFFIFSIFQIFEVIFKSEFCQVLICEGWEDFFAKRLLKRKFVNNSLKWLV